MKIAFLYAGQGSQYVGMGQELYDDHAVVRERVDQASDILGYDVKDILFHDEDKLNDTRYTQPLMFVLYAAITDLLRLNGIESTHTCGLSLGEYGALYDAGCITFEQGLHLLEQRGAHMAAASDHVKGAMTAILGGDAQMLEQLVANAPGYVTIANYNTYGQLVISGEQTAVNYVAESALEQGGKRAIPLNTSGPFHSALMNEAALAFAGDLERTAFQAANKHLLVNVTGDYLAGDLATILTEQITHSVRFYQMIERLLEDGVYTFVEIGPKRVLGGFIKKINRTVTILNVEDRASLETTRTTIGG